MRPCFLPLFPSCQLLDPIFQPASHVEVDRPARLPAGLDHPDDRRGGVSAGRWGADSVLVIVIRQAGAGGAFPGRERGRDVCAIDGQPDKFRDRLAGQTLRRIRPGAADPDRDPFRRARSLKLVSRRQRDQGDQRPRDPRVVPPPPVGLVPPDEVDDLARAAMDPGLEAALRVAADGDDPVIAAAPRANPPRSAPERGRGCGSRSSCRRTTRARRRGRLARRRTGFDTGNVPERARCS